MITITPIYPYNAEKKSYWFFTNGYQTKSWGDPGRWQGNGARLLHLNEPVQFAPFQHLLAGRTPDGASSLLPNSNPARRVLGWRLDIRAPQSLTVLWALGPPKTRVQLERIQNAAVSLALWGFERQLIGWSGQQDAYPAGLFATFNSRVGWDQAPGLGTAAFVFNLGFYGDGTVKTFTNQQVVRQQAELRVAHLATIRRLLQRDVGHFEHLPHTDLQLVGIPTGQSQAFFCDPSYRVDQARLGRLARLRGEELFGGWQREAKALGWGPNQACAYLREARNVKLKTDLVNGYQWLCEKGLDRVQRARASLKRLLGPSQAPKHSPTSSKSREQGHTQTHSH